MTTPGELNKITKSVIQAAADLLSREGNEALSAEELAEELANTVVSEVISSYEEIQAKSYNLVVLGHFRLDDDQSYVAAVGPLSTRAVQRARAVGEGFAWDYKTRRGTGQYVLVPLVRNPHEAWDEARLAEMDEYIHTLGSITPEIGKPSYEPMRFELNDETRARIAEAWEATGEELAKKLGPHCLCGRYTFAKTSNLGDPVTLGCPRHPEGRSSDQQGPP